MQESNHEYFVKGVKVFGGVIAGATVTCVASGVFLYFSHVNQEAAKNFQDAACGKPYDLSPDILLYNCPTTYHHILNCSDYADLLCSTHKSALYSWGAALTGLVIGGVSWVYVLTYRGSEDERKPVPNESNSESENIPVPLTDENSEKKPLVVTDKTYSNCQRFTLWLREKTGVTKPPALVPEVTTQQPSSHM